MSLFTSRHIALLDANSFTPAATYLRMNPSAICWRTWFSLPVRVPRPTGQVGEGSDIPVARYRADRRRCMSSWEFIGGQTEGTGRQDAQEGVWMPSAWRLMSSRWPRANTGTFNTNRYRPRRSSTITTCSKTKHGDQGRDHKTASRADRP